MEEKLKSHRKYYATIFLNGNNSIEVLIDEVENSRLYYYAKSDYEKFKNNEFTKDELLKLKFDIPISSIENVIRILIK